ncbi:hypothetical protein ACFU8Q_41130 [Streptomyces sp. NPDC057543]|uniref:hypothetical protein n=1 Tax=Streptomyces sp. NPDC057543 TaxID=3346163 RepID=UPI00367790E9
MSHPRTTPRITPSGPRPPGDLETEPITASSDFGPHPATLRFTDDLDAFLTRT